MRISGLATGMDTESIIRDLMKANRIPLDKITQKKQYLEWQLDDYRSINRNLRSMSDNMFDTIMRQSTFMAKSVNVSNPDSVNIKALNATSEFSGTISVQQLATQATVQSKKPIGDDRFDTKQTLATAGITGDEDGNTSIEITALGKDGGFVSKTLNFNVNTDSIESVLKKINSESGVSAFYDKQSGQFAVSAKNSGTKAKENDPNPLPDISIKGAVAEYMGIADDSDGLISRNGENAKFTFNGLTTERSSNTFQINGFEINLKQVTTSDVTFSSAPDTDKILDSVVKFVDDYNKMIEELNAKIREPKYRDFQPLSDEQKKEMKEKEIELWEEKAKSGTLRNDSTISSMLQKLRNVLNGTVEGTNGKIRLADIGITTSTSYSENGKLLIDEDKLRTAIAEDPNKVYELFAKTSDIPGEAGLATQFRAVVDESRKVITDKAGNVGAVNDTFTLGRNLKEMNKQIERFEDRLKMMEDRYWRQFTAMERAIQRANAQSASLMNAFGGM